MGNILEVKNLNTTFDTEAGTIHVVKDVSFAVPKGKTVGIVGESGCGKSVTALSIMRLLPKPAGKISSGEIFLNDTDLVKLKADEMYHVRGKKISMIFQEPMTALNPVHRIGKQLAECFELHFPDMNREEITKASIEMLSDVGIPVPEKRLKEYPHQLSGGMRQRVMIAMALACRPDIIIADEPTTALDVTIQAQILRLMIDLQEEKGTSIIFITHDLGVIAELSDEVIVMYCGQIVEKAPVVEIFKNPRHPYTKGLLESIPRLTHPSKTPLNTIEGMVPDLMSIPAGCRFQDRCSFVEDNCRCGDIEVEEVSAEHQVRCHHWKKLD